MIAHYIDIQPIKIERLCQLSSKEKTLILQTSSFALKLIHSLGIIHGDLKPDNIPISKSEMGGYISKITDCGDAFFSNDIPEERQIVCTEPYWSPELGAYKRGYDEAKQYISCKSDVFTMGLIFHEWWTGDFPSYVGSDEAYPYQIIEKVWPNKISISSSVPSWLASLIVDMLCPNPSNRPSMEEVFEAIKNTKYTRKQPVPVPIPIPPVSYERIKSVFSRLPSASEMKERYTDDSVSHLMNLVVFAKENLKRLSQSQVDKLADKIDSAVSMLETKKEQTFLKKIDDAVSYISSTDLSRFTPESRKRLDQLVDFYKRQRDSINDEENASRVYSALASAFKSLVPRTDFSIEPICPLPAPYTKVEILSDDCVMAYYGATGKIKLSAHNAINMKLVRRK